MIFAVPHHTSRDEAAAEHPGAEYFDLEEYIEHKIGMSIPDLVADSPWRYRVIEEEALRDLVVMSEITGSDRIVRLGPDTLSNPECVRLISSLYQPHDAQR